MIVGASRHKRADIDFDAGGAKFCHGLPGDFRIGSSIADTTGDPGAMMARRRAVTFPTCEHGSSVA